MPTPRTLSRESLILDPAIYLAEIRPTLRARMIPLRAARRIQLGDSLALEFENADTLLYQVQEMLLVEGVVDAAGVDLELEVYSRLLPTPHSLCATLFIEADDVATVKEELLVLTGIQHLIRLEITTPDHGILTCDGVEVPGLDESGPSEVTHAVHFLRFTFSDAARDAFRDPAVPVELVVDHPAYAASTAISGELRLSLLADLSHGS
ncbi:MAG: DUF3501 family protein [Actinobacteria bacterium]|nr:DUF3501 family protein [Actinomycetota bacterium]